MNDDTINRAEEDAIRLVTAIQELKEYEAAQPDRSYMLDGVKQTYREKSGKHRATVKRRSMDLTRTLADLRAGR